MISFFLTGYLGLIKMQVFISVLAVHTENNTESERANHLIPQKVVSHCSSLCQKAAYLLTNISAYSHLEVNG